MLLTWSGSSGMVGEAPKAGIDVSGSPALMFTVVAMACSRRDSFSSPAMVPISEWPSLWFEAADVVLLFKEVVAVEGTEDDDVAG